MNWLRRRRLARENRVLSGLRGGSWSFGLQVAERAGMSYGSALVHLVRFERDGIAESRWQTHEEAGGKPRRRLYRLADPYECPRCGGRMALRFTKSHEAICAWAERWDVKR